MYKLLGLPTKKRGTNLVCIVMIISLAAASCSKSAAHTYYDGILPKDQKPVWGASLTPQMQTVIEKLESFKSTSLDSLSATDARKQPTIEDAALAVMKDFSVATPVVNVDTSGKDIPVTGGNIHLRIYTPKTGKASYPIVVYYHGGGWVVSSIDTYNASAQALSEQADAIVISVAYRLAPEFQYPTAHNDSYAAYLWAMQNAGSIKGDSSKIAVSGEGAGGNLAAGVSLMAKSNGTKMPVHEVLIYPSANYNDTSLSYALYDSAKPLNLELMHWFYMNYLPSPDLGKDSLISLVTANLAGMPPTTIIAAEIDPLETEGLLLAIALKSAGVTVTYQKYVGVTHDFFGLSTVVPEAKQAQVVAAEQLKNAFK